MALVGASGPASNLLLAVIAAAAFKIVMSVSGVHYYQTNPLTSVLFFAVFINVMLAVFNLIPIPPLDGSRVLMWMLPDDLAEQYSRIESFGFIIIFVLLFLGLFRIVILPIVSVVVFLLTGIRIY
jgi:Zn-dependent protease